MYSEARGLIRSKVGHSGNGSESMDGSMKPIKRLESLSMIEKRPGMDSADRKEVRFSERNNLR